MDADMTRIVKIIGDGVIDHDDLVALSGLPDGRGHAAIRRLIDEGIASENAKATLNKGKRVRLISLNDYHAEDGFHYRTRLLSVNKQDAYLRLTLPKKLVAMMALSPDTVVDVWMYDGTLHVRPSDTFECSCEELHADACEEVLRWKRRIAAMA